MWYEVSFVLLAYIYGSIPFIWVVAKLKKVNLEEHGTSVSGSTLYKAAGFSAMLCGGFGDFTKGVLPVGIGYYLLDFPLEIVCLAGLAALIGQCWPIFLKFHGGRGGSAGMGMAAVLVREMTLIAFIPFIAAFIWHGASGQSRKKSSRVVPLGFLASFAILPALAYLWGKPQEITLAFISVFLLLVIRRLTADLRKELREKQESLPKILLNRLLYDRSHR